MIRNIAKKVETSTVSVGPSLLESAAGVVENSSSSNISPAAPTVTLTTRDLQEFTVDAEIVRLFGIKAPEPKSTIITYNHHHHPFYRKRLFNDFLDDASDGFPGMSLVSEEEGEEEEEEEEELNQPQPSLPNISGPAFAVALSWAKHHLSRPKQLQASTMAYRLVEHRDAGPRAATSGSGSASGGTLQYLANRLFPVDLWDVQFVSGLSGEQLQMLLEAANYLNMGWLLDRQCQVAVRKMTEGGRDFVRDTAEEEANLLKVARECSFDTSAAAAARRVNSNNNSTGNGNGNVLNSGNKCQKVAAGVDVKGKKNMSTNRNTNTSTSTSIASTGNLAASFSKRLQMMSKGRVAGGMGKSAVISKSSATSSSNTIVDVPAIAAAAAAAAAAPVQRPTIAAKSG